MMSESAEQKVTLRSLLVIDEETGRYFLGELPFAGIAVVLFDDGRTKIEKPFHDGRVQGVVREWYPSGTLQSARTTLEGRYHGPSREWFENGQLRRDAKYEFGFCMRESVWDEFGKLLQTRELGPESPNYTAVERLRAVDWGDPAVERLLRLDSSKLGDSRPLDL
jgi:antitoxin component YwqK of YwqJK toxin-antitoxin module